MVIQQIVQSRILFILYNSKCVLTPHEDLQLFNVGKCLTHRGSIPFTYKGDGVKYQMSRFHWYQDTVEISQHNTRSNDYYMIHITVLFSSFSTNNTKRRARYSKPIAKAMQISMQLQSSI